MNMLAPLEIGICCADLDRLVAFYTDVVGCSFVNVLEVPAEKSRQAGVTDAGYRVARLQTPYGERLKLLQPGRKPEPPESAAQLLSRRNAYYITFIIDDLDTMLQRLVAAGCEMLAGPEKLEVRPGTFLVFCRDPEGNVLEFVQFADVSAYRPDLARGH
jgi:predicted enzyme related to lactoylglutathione lyase